MLSLTVKSINRVLYVQHNFYLDTPTKIYFFPLSLNSRMVIHYCRPWADLEKILGGEPNIVGIKIANCSV